AGAHWPGTSEPAWQSSFCVNGLGRALLLRDFLLNPDDDEFRGLERREPDDDDDAAGIDVVLRHGVTEAAAYEVGVRRFFALEGARPEQPVHEAADVGAQRGPEAVIVGLEHRPLDAVVNALFDHDRGAPNGDVAPLRIGLRRERARAPNHRAEARERAQCVHAERIQNVLLAILDHVLQPGDAEQSSFHTGGRLPHAAPRVDLGPHAGGETARWHEYRGR